MLNKQFKIDETKFYIQSFVFSIFCNKTLIDKIVNLCVIQVLSNWKMFWIPPTSSAEAVKGKRKFTVRVNSSSLPHVCPRNSLSVKVGKC